ncbi:MAG: hypothetical protein HKP52_12210 [Desulfofustis sp.]|nr:hypothetical protein [Desulfofustis sp.]NNF47250.1 hypothetical protein [Desulfofustis sp.]NNK14993.1 hypothetical protein [Desulfofustis sp.]NNK57940.1 hypothetical protein [Desulfofustis sp.]RZW25976.1 MAG: hypothetical protein EX260_01950 [Desulfobulbaceae bacterium]
MSGYSPESPDPSTICFGLSPELDRQSCGAYLQLLGRPAVAQTLCSRLSQAEIDQLIELISGLMRNHFSKHEYHSLFLDEEHSRHSSEDQ